MCTATQLPSCSRHWQEEAKLRGRSMPARKLSITATIRAGANRRACRQQVAPAVPAAGLGVDAGSEVVGLTGGRRGSKGWLIGWQMMQSTGED